MNGRSILIAATRLGQVKGRTRSGHPSPAESGGAGTERTLNYLDLLDALFTVAEQRISCINWCLTSLPESPRR